MARALLVALSHPRPTTRTPTPSSSFPSLSSAVLRNVAWHHHPLNHGHGHGMMRSHVVGPSRAEPSAADGLGHGWLGRGASRGAARETERETRAGVTWSGSSGVVATPACPCHAKVSPRTATSNAPRQHPPSPIIDILFSSQSPRISLCYSHFPWPYRECPFGFPLHVSPPLATCSR
jgi:hypothetical protein